MSGGRPVTEAELHAYVDGALEDERRAEVDAYLQNHPDVATNVRGFSQQREQLRAALTPVAEEPLPPELNLAHLIEAQRRPSSTIPWRAAAAALLVFGLGGAGGWSLHGLTATRSGINALAQEAAYNYAVYSTDQLHPVEFQPSQRDDLVSYLSQRLQTPVKIPDLSASGYRFLGGRLVATPNGPAGLLIYDNGRGVRLVMFLRAMEVDKNRPVMKRTESGPVNDFSWSSNGIGYSIAGAAPQEIIHPLADEVRRQVSRSS